MNPCHTISETQKAAREAKDANAETCFLALASKDGIVSVRTLILRGIVENKFTLFFNQTSPKWSLLAEQAHFELLLWYPTQQKQFRINGQSRMLDRDEVKDQWQAKPAGAKYMDFLYQERPQSREIESRETLVEKIEEIKQNKLDSDLEVNSLEAPKEVSGVELSANKIELLDLNNQDRIHDRRCFQLKNKIWQTQVLVP